MSGPEMIHRDEEHLRLLALYHFVSAGVAFLVWVIIPFVAGGMYRMGAAGGSEAALLQQRMMQGLLVGGLSTLLFSLNGWSLRHRRHYISCLLMSIMECIALFPVGMILGCSAIMVLRRDTVKALFQTKRPSP